MPSSGEDVMLFFIFFKRNSHDLPGFSNNKLAQDSFRSTALCYNKLVYRKSGEGEKLCKSGRTIQKTQALRQSNSCAS